MSQHHYTQLSLEERIIIQNRLENGETIRDIAVSIGSLAKMQFSPLLNCLLIP